MNINILTMHRVYNYGSFLQAYALKRTVETLGHKVTFIDPEPGFKTCKPIVPPKNKRIDKYCINRLIFKQKEKKFERMHTDSLRKYLGVTNHLVFDKPADLTIIGSDEVFNFNPSNPWGISPDFFGGLHNSREVISYAASCGYSTIDDLSSEWKQKIRLYLNNLNSISVRDQNTFEFVTGITNKKAAINLDPVLIYDFQNDVHYKESSSFRYKNRYMIIYSYRNRISDEDEILAIKKFAKDHNLKTVCLGSFQFWADDYVIVDPFEALHYFDNAACVVTDTFHGTVISSIFHKKFAVIIRDSNKNKLEDLVKRLNLSEHVASNAEMIGNRLEYCDDYKKFDSIIIENRNKTMDYLSAAGI